MEVVLELLLTHTILSGLIGENHLLYLLQDLGRGIDLLLYKLQDALDFHLIFRFVDLNCLQEFIFLLRHTIQSLQSKNQKRYFYSLPRKTIK